MIHRLKTRWVLGTAKKCMDEKIPADNRATTPCHHRHPSAFPYVSWHSGTKGGGGSKFSMNEKKIGHEKQITAFPQMSPGSAPTIFCIHRETATPHPTGHDQFGSESSSIRHCEDFCPKNWGWVHARKVSSAGQGTTLWPVL